MNNEKSLIMQIVEQLYLKLIPLVTGFRMEQGGGGTHTESHLTLCEGLKMDGHAHVQD